MPLLDSPAWAPAATRSAAPRSPVAAVLLELARAAALDRCALQLWTHIHSRERALFPIHTMQSLNSTTL